MIELLGADPDLTVVGEAGSVAEAMVRERALLDLLGEGLTNKQIGMQRRTQAALFGSKLKGERGGPAATRARSSGLT